MPNRLTNSKLNEYPATKPIVGFREPMLAPTQGTPDEFLTAGSLRLPKLLSPKLDGIRAVYHQTGLLTRSMKIVQNHFINDTINEIAAKIHERLRGEFTGIDGELIVGAATDGDLVYPRTSSGVMAREGEPDFTFHVFDRYEQGLHIREVHPQYTERLERAKRIVGMADSPRVQLVEHIPCYDIDHLFEFEGWALDAGYEGVMLNDPYALYKCGRATMISQQLMKRKPFVDFEVMILDTYEQNENTNEAVTDERGRSKRSSHQSGKVGKGTLGGFTVRAVDGTVFNVGSGVGLTNQLRQELWWNRDVLPGQLLKVRKQRVGEKDKPRQPKFLGFRSPDDLSPKPKNKKLPGEPTAQQKRAGVTPEGYGLFG